MINFSTFLIFMLPVHFNAQEECITASRYDNISIEVLQYVYSKLNKIGFALPKSYVKTKTTQELLDKIPCGTAAVDPEQAIIGGSDAPERAFPWQAIVVSNSSYCGGLLISESWVLTAAHCTAMAVALGVMDLGGKNDTWQIRGISLQVGHQHYNNLTLENDILLLKLSDPVDFNDYVQPICLPKEGDDFEKAGPCYITGFGKTQPNEEDQLPPLQFRKAYVLPQNICVYIWKLLGSVVDMRQICTDKDDGSNGVCSGDSGGPLSCRVGDRFYAAGVVSYVHKGCDSELAPDVFTRVSEFMDWILLTIQEHGLY